MHPSVSALLRLRRPAPNDPAPNDPTPHDAAPHDPEPPTDRPGRSDELLPVLLAAALSGSYAAWSLLRAARVEAGAYDLGIFTQAVAGYAHLHAPMVPIKGPGVDQLGDHFSPVLALLAPVYRLWPSTYSLLVAQALLLALSSVPVTRLAVRRVGTAAGTTIGVAYGLSWGLQGAVAFDVHEIAFAVPLLAFCTVALADRRWRAAVGWALPLVLVKEDLGLTVAAVGGYLLVQRRWRPGAATVAAGAGAFLLSTLVLIPRLNHLTHDYRYWVNVRHGSYGRPRGAELLHMLAGLPQTVVTPVGKPLLVLWVVGVTALVALRSPITLVAVPTLLWRLLTDNPLYWSTGAVHYNAVLMPIVFVAMVDGLTRLRDSRRAASRNAARLAPAAAAAVCLLALPHGALWGLTRPGTYRTPAHAAAARDLAGRIPSGARVSAGTYLVPLLVDRCAVWLFPDVHRRPVDYVLVDTTRLHAVPLTYAQQVAAVAALPRDGFALVAERDGIRLYRPPGGLAP